jgi:hypothetical protein
VRETSDVPPETCGLFKPTTLVPCSCTACWRTVGKIANILPVLPEIPSILLLRLYAWKRRTVPKNGHVKRGPKTRTCIPRQVLCCDSFKMDHVVMDAAAATGVTYKTGRPLTSALSGGDISELPHFVEGYTLFDFTYKGCKKLQISLKTASLMGLCFILQICSKAHFVWILFSMCTCF